MGSSHRSAEEPAGGGGGGGEAGEGDHRAGGRLQEGSVRQGAPQDPVGEDPPLLIG